MAQHGARARAALPVLLALTGGLALRVWMLRNVFQVNGDSLVYGDLARNLLLHGRFALTLPRGEMYPTLIRLPGYPLFLAVCFRLFGMENYFAAACVQIALDLLGCLLLAGFVRRIAPAAASRGAALATLWLAALCPFTASYAIAPLTEAPTLFALALALWAMAQVPRQAELGECTVVYLRGHLGGAAAARWSAGCRRFCACTRDRIAMRQWSRKDSAAQAGPHDGGLRFAGAGSVCRVDGPQLARLSCF